MTFSIAGRCARTGMLGAVVTTSAIAVGSRCAWAEAGIGAVLTHHRTDPRLGPKVLEHLKRGTTTDVIVEQLERADPDLKWRQLAIITADGKAAFFNGARITSIAKGRIGQIRRRREHPAQHHGGRCDDRELRGEPGSTSGGAADARHRSR